jgi:acetate kinase
MHILVFNCGSSSQAFRVYRTPGPGRVEVAASGKAVAVATRTQASPEIRWTIGERTGTTRTDLSSHRRAAEAILTLLKEHRVSIDAVGHRFVHGGELFDRAARVDVGTLAQLRECLPLAPIHNPNSYSVIEVCQERLPGIPQIVVFDTAFHSRLPEAARTYALPQELAGQHGFRKVGFHGLSYQYVSARAAELLGRPLDEVKLILCHLGTGGSSVAAVRDGHSIDTSMGYSPLAGLVMSTRSGDLDPEVVLELVRQGRTAEEASRILNQQSGLIGLSGTSSNLAEVLEAAEQGNPDCRLAFDVYTHRLKLYLGAYTWLLGGADAIVFTDDIGVRSWQLRQAVCQGVEGLGVVLDVEANRQAPGDRASVVSAPGSRTQILVVPTDEERVILEEVLGLLFWDS